jgi:hypothetical protein
VSKNMILAHVEILCLLRFHVELVTHDGHSFQTLCSSPQENHLCACRIRDCVCVCKHVAVVALTIVSCSGIESSIVLFASCLSK